MICDSPDLTSLLCSYNTEALISTKKKSQGTRLKNLILSGELVPKELTKRCDDWKTSFRGHKLPSLQVSSSTTSHTSARPHEFHTQVSVLADLPPPHTAKSKTHTRSRSDVSGMNKVSTRSDCQPSLSLHSR